MSLFVGALVLVFIAHCGAISEYFYRMQMKFAKVIFLQVSVCPWGVSLTEISLARDPLDRGPPGQRSPSQRPDGQRPRLDRDHLHRDPLDRDPAWTETPLPNPDPPEQRPPGTVKSGWYTPYWSAFLCFIYLHICQFVSS